MKCPKKHLQFHGEAQSRFNRNENTNHNSFFWLSTINHAAISDVRAWHYLQKSSQGWDTCPTLPYSSTDTPSHLGERPNARCSEKVRR